MTWSTKAALYTLKRLSYSHYRISQKIDGKTLKYDCD